jgi:hypothetical protein
VVACRIDGNLEELRMLHRLFFVSFLLPALAVAAEDAGPKPPPWHLLDIWWDIGRDTAFESYSIDATIVTFSMMKSGNHEELQHCGGVGACAAG